MSAEWSPSSWRTKTVLQMPTYPDTAAHQQALERLARLPPLVTSWEVETLKGHIARAGRGEAFVLQGGDCAESFDECESTTIANKLKILLQMSLVLLQGSKRPVVRVGRFAGQYAKPRSSDIERRDGEELPSYRGDMVNQLGFTAEDRTPDPERLLKAYARSALTLNFIRSLAAGGFADLHHPEYWDLGFVTDPELRRKYREKVDHILDAIRFVETVVPRDEDFNRVDFFTSHEGLHLDYEEAQTRRVPYREGYWNLSTHLPWIGDRTRSLDGAHIEYFRGIENPIGVKVGPSMGGSELVELIGILSPENEAGRLMLIHRFGIDRIGDHLPDLVAAVRKAGLNVTWCCDPMHGNTQSTSSGYKTRSFDDVLGELERALEIHEGADSILGGVHFELTGDDVTECVGGACGLTEADLTRAYKTQVDPRLNCGQALEMAMCIADKMQAMARR